jgi:hypothetical protein
LDFGRVRVLVAPACTNQTRGKCLPVIMYIAKCHPNGSSDMSDEGHGEPAEADSGQYNTHNPALGQHCLSGLTHILRLAWRS